MTGTVRNNTARRKKQVPEKFCRTYSECHKKYRFSKHPTSFFQTPHVDVFPCSPCCCRSSGSCCWLSASASPRRGPYSSEFCATSECSDRNLSRRVGPRRDCRRHPKRFFLVYPSASLSGPWLPLSVLLCDVVRHRHEERHVQRPRPGSRRRGFVQEKNNAAHENVSRHAH